MSPDLGALVAGAITVIRLSDAPGRDPVERVVTTVARVDLALADRLHDGAAIRPYATVRRARTIDVVACDDRLASALLTGDLGARLARRARPADLGHDGAGSRVIRLAFETPAHFRTAGFEYQIPDPFHVFGSLAERWQALGWSGLDWPVGLKRVGVWPETLLFRAAPSAGGRPQRGFVGVVRFDLLGLPEDERAVLWRLARFAEYRGVGKHTTYGLGRVRVLAPGEDWVLGRRVSVWDAV